MEEQKDANLAMYADEHAMRLEFADIVRVDANAERVILTFIQRYPEAEAANRTETKPPIPGVQYMPNGRIVSRVVVSWPHLIRIRDMLNKHISERASDVVAAAQTIMEGKKAIDSEK